MKTTADLLSYLGANAVTIRNDSTGAIALPNGDTAFVSETNKDGKLTITVRHPPKGGRAQSAYQTFTSRDRALKGILAHQPLKAAEPKTADLTGLSWDELDMIVMGLRAYLARPDVQADAEETAKATALKAKVFAARGKAN